MNKIIDALKLAENTLRDIIRVYKFETGTPVTALAAIRKALADHIANADKMIGCAYCDNPLFAGTKCNNCGRVTLAEPVQEPVAWLRKDHTKTMSNEDKLSWIAAGHTDITDEYTIPLYTTAPSDLGEPIAYLFTDIQSGDTEASCDPYWKTSPYWISEPLYTTPPSVEAAIEATKEKAAKVFHEQAELFQIDYYVAQTIVEVIRSMK